MEFKFRLRPIDEIEPWGRDTGEPSLFWFGITDGWFWIEVDDQELFRYSDAIQDYWQTQYPQKRPVQLLYDDYQVAQSWGTLLELLPAILDPLPEDLAALVADADAWRDWEVHALDWLQKGDNDTPGDAYEIALLWWQNRTWDADYLAHPPLLWIWRAADAVHIRWDNRELTSDGIPVWEATQGEITLPVSEFLKAVESFHTRFVSEMAERVNAILKSGGIPGIDVDLDGLVNMQEGQLGEFAHAANPWAAQVRRVFTWDEIREAMRVIADGSTFSAG